MTDTTRQSNTGCTFCDAIHNLINSMVSWVKTPFNSGGSALNWVLFVGLLIVAVWFWQHTLLSIREEI